METLNRGDRLLGLSGERPASPFVAEGGGTVFDKNLMEQVATQMQQRAAEMERWRNALLEAGVSEEVLANPEGAEMGHLSEDEQEQFNDAVREHRSFNDELEHDLRALQRARDALGIRHSESFVQPPQDEGSVS